MFAKLLVTIPLFLFLLAGTSYAAETYKDFQHSNSDFKNLDKKLDENYQKLMEILPYHERRALKLEDERWRGNLFRTLMIYDVEGNKTPEQSAKIVIQNRIDDLAKLINLPEADNILGMPIKFGMSRKQVATKLKLKDIAQLSVKNEGENEKKAYHLKLFGWNYPIFFSFMDTTFVKVDYVKKEEFGNFVKDVLKNQLNKRGACRINSLYKVEAGHLADYKEFEILKEELRKKYKSAYPFSNWDDTFWIKPSDNEKAWKPDLNNLIFEDGHRYISTEGLWSRLDNEFNIEYLAKPYATLHIGNLSQLEQKICDVEDYDTSLGILPEFASIEDVIWAIGGRKVKWTPYDFGFYLLETGLQNQNEKNYLDDITIFMTPENKAFGFKFDIPGGQFEENLVKNLGKKFKRLEDLLDYGSDFIWTGSIHDFDAGVNIISIGYVPQAANVHQLWVVNKGVVKKYEDLQKEREAAEHDPEAEKRREREARDEARKF